MRVVICKSPDAAGEYGAAEVAARLNQVLVLCARARLLLATGQSQFETLRSLVRRPVDWARVDGYHLDEYIGIGADHPASFRRYLRERVAGVVPLSMHFVDPSSSSALAELSAVVASAPMDVALVGIGENGHLAFNDPPADFETTAPYLEVELDAGCRAQQLHEGWFAELRDVPSRAVTMSVHEVMRAGEIISVVPHEAKAPIISRLLTDDAITPELPATMLRRHQRVTVVLDRASAGLLPNELWDRCVVL
jgi:glucosamine-6-phosphate deaminase